VPPAQALLFAFVQGRIDGAMLPGCASYIRIIGSIVVFSVVEVP
jgi:hypothetical protein